MADNLAHPDSRCRVLTIDDLPDDVLLAIFDFYVVRYQEVFREYDMKSTIESWQTLVHVCRRWRCLVFVSPRRLKLQLCCIRGAAVSARKSLDVWPALPLLINGVISHISVDNIIADLKHSGRICQIILHFGPYTRLENFWTATQVPFPELVVLDLSFGGWRRGPGPVLPDSFLDGSVPRLRSLKLTSITFPGLPKLLLSATHLVILSLCNIPRSGYISPEAMATCLSMLTSLRTIQLEFKSPQSSPDQESRHPPPLTRSVLPALTCFRFEGANEYLEDLLSRIDAPQVDRLLTTFFNDIHFDTPELNQFISRTPTFGAYNEARFVFSRDEALVRLQSHPRTPDRPVIEVTISCQVSHQWLSSLPFSSLAQICTFPLRLLLTMENLYIYEIADKPPFWMDGMENSKWLDLLLPFTAVKNLYLSKLFAPRIALALQLEGLTGGRTTEVLPALQNVLLEKFQPSEPVQEDIAQFISARQLTNHPVAISAWDRDLGGDESSEVDD